MWWTNMLAIEDAPIIVRELLQERQVVATHEEIEEALRWARSVDGWSDEHPPLVGLDGRP